eukprot:TRINITY_DN125_c1_g1_i1.p1 TRINITY_DN125_c1_g1~~TRINITY_DN125_c1_g1_i1.p1  ORF type:complete len:281 (+),score=46.57 TRINITY_DN125_c1_g1_i1:73-915(+)
MEINGNKCLQIPVLDAVLETPSIFVKKSGSNSQKNPQKKPAHEDLRSFARLEDYTGSKNQESSTQKRKRLKTNKTTITFCGVDKQPPRAVSVNAKDRRQNKKSIIRLPRPKSSFPPTRSNAKSRLAVSRPQSQPLEKEVAPQNESFFRVQKTPLSARRPSETHQWSPIYKQSRTKRERSPKSARVSIAKSPRSPVSPRFISSSAGKNSKPVVPNTLDGLPSAISSMERRGWSPRTSSSREVFNRARTSKSFSRLSNEQQAFVIARAKSIEENHVASLFSS